MYMIYKTSRTAPLTTHEARGKAMTREHEGRSCEFARRDMCALEMMMALLWHLSRST